MRTTGSSWCRPNHSRPFCVLLAGASRGGGLRGTDNGSQAETHALQSLRRCLADGCSGTCSRMGQLVVSDVLWCSRYVCFPSLRRLAIDLGRTRTCNPDSVGRCLVHWATRPWCFSFFRTVRSKHGLSEASPSAMRGRVISGVDASSWSAKDRVRPPQLSATASVGRHKKRGCPRPQEARPEQLGRVVRSGASRTLVQLREFAAPGAHPPLQPNTA